MNPAFQRFLRLSETDRADVFNAAAQRLGTRPTYVEKDFWVCLVLDVLYNGLPADHPQLLFKGGTSLSKAFGLIHRFSEDIDIVVSRHDLGFVDQTDPLNIGADLSKTKRAKLLKSLKAECCDYLARRLEPTVREILDSLGADVGGSVDVTNQSEPTILLTYKSRFDGGEESYVKPRVKIESGARGALAPHVSRTIAPFIAEELAEWDLKVAGITTIEAARTFWEKLLILHSEYCGYRDKDELPNDHNLNSRHYYDVAVISQTEIGRNALDDRELWTAVREHNLIAFTQPSKKFAEAVPGSTHIVPQPKLREAIEKDYDKMQGMILGEVRAFEWIIEQLKAVEATLNRV